MGSDRFNDGKQLYATGGLRGVWRPEQLKERLGTLNFFLNSLGTRRKRAWFRLLGSVAALIALAIVLPWLAGHGAALALLGKLALLTCLASIVAALIAIFRLGVKEVDKDAVTMLEPLLRCLGPDLDAKASLKVNASLRPPTSAGLKVSSGATYATANYPNCVDHHYKRDILDFGCQLRDGTRLVIGMTEQTIEKVLRKKNARGRHKVKKKLRRKVTIKIRLLLDERRCRLTGNVRLPGGATMRVRRHPRGARIFLTLRNVLNMKEQLDARVVLSALAGVYGGISMAPSTRTTTPGGAS